MLTVWHVYCLLFAYWLTATGNWEVLILLVWNFIRRWRNNLWSEGISKMLCYCNYHPKVTMEGHILLLRFDTWQKVVKNSVNLLQLHFSIALYCILFVLIFLTWIYCVVNLISFFLMFNKWKDKKKNVNNLSTITLIYKIINTV